MHVIVYNEIFTGGPPSERDWASFEKQLSRFCCENLATLKTSLNPIDFDCMEQKKRHFYLNILLKALEKHEGK